MLKLVALIVLAMATCGDSDRPRSAEDLVRARLPPVQILDEGGEPVREEAMLADLNRARVIYLGERHDRPVDHAMQHRILTALYHHDSDLAVGFTMFQTPFQNVLDDWTRGQLDEVALRRESEWDARWGHAYDFYRPMLEYVRARHIPALALHAPQEMMATVTEAGLEGLTEEERAALPALDIDVAAHREFMQAWLADHQEAGPRTNFDQWYAAQVLHLTLAAQQIGNRLQGAGAPSRVLVFAGRVDLEEGLGIQPRVPGQLAHRTVIAVDRGDDDAIEALVRRHVADYYFLVDPNDENFDAAR